MTGRSRRIIPFLLLLLAAPLCLAQAPESGGHEFQVWSGGGHSVSGGRGNTGVWNLGLRYGWVLTDPHLPGFLKGQFEYAVDAVPAFLVAQPANTAYGVGINPVNFKWDFVQRGRVVPYLELGGGTLFTSKDVPAGTGSVNFTSGVALGAHILGAKRNLSLELRYMHISNAGLARPNPGINTVQVRLGFGWFGK